MQWWPSLSTSHYYLLLLALIIAGVAVKLTGEPHSSLSCVPPKPGLAIAANLDLLPSSPNAHRVLVTGAAGFIGSHVADYLVHSLHLQVIAVDDLSGGFLDNVLQATSTQPGVKLVIGDLKNESFVSTLFIDYGPFIAVYHLAAYAAEGMSHFIRSFNYRNNLVASINLLNQAVLSQVHTFVFTSSIAVYGEIPPPMKESDTPHPHDPYGIAKYAMELDLFAAHRMFNINYVIFRPHNVYGERQNIIDKYRNVIGIFFSNIRRNQTLPIFGDGLQTRAFTYIDDVAPAIASAPFISAALNEVFNVGSDQPYTLLQLARLVSQAMNVSYNVTHLPARQEVVHAQSDHTRIQCVFGLGGTVSLESGIHRVAQWVKHKQYFQPVEFDHVEVMQNMPESWITESMRQYDEQQRRARIKSP